MRLAATAAASGEAPLDDDAERAALERAWASPPGLIAWLTNVDHKDIARRYIVTALVFFVLAGVEALVMRLQLARPARAPRAGSVQPVLHHARDHDDVPVRGARDGGDGPLPRAADDRHAQRGLPADERLRLLHVRARRRDPVRGVPPERRAGRRMVRLRAAVRAPVLAGQARGHVGADDHVHRDRGAGGRHRDRRDHVQVPGARPLPRLLAAARVVDAGDGLHGHLRHAGRHARQRHACGRAPGEHALLQPGRGRARAALAASLLVLRHPEVYIIFVPALGFVSTIVTVFSGRPVFGYVAMVLSLVATAFLGFGLWVHHMFATGLPQLGQSFFTAASMMIAIPSGLQIFCWLATLWAGRPRLATPLLFVVGFVAIFVLGGLTGVMLAAGPFDLQAHDTFFVVAHFHYVLIGGAVFPLFGAFFFWFPKMTGRLLNERAGRWTFWLLFAGFNVTFFPMHVLGLRGMPRRVYTYPPGLGWETLNLASTAGALVMAVAALTFVINLVVSVRRGPLAGRNPWGADTLEWSTPSPPPPYNFVRLPTVSGREPLWTQSTDQPIVTGLRSDRREILVTRLLDAEPDHRQILDGPSIWPLLTALAAGIGLVVTIFTPWGVVVGAVLCFATLTGWFWPHQTTLRSAAEE